MYNINNICYQRIKKRKEVWELNVIAESILAKCVERNDELEEAVKYRVMYVNFAEKANIIQTVMLTLDV